MDYAQFKNLVTDQGKSAFQSASALQELVNEYPFFQTAHLLYSKVLHDQNSLRYERQLKLTASLAGDRKILYQLVHDRERTQEVNVFQSTRADVAPSLTEQEIPVSQIKTSETRTEIADSPELNPFAIFASADLDDVSIPPVQSKSPDSVAWPSSDRILDQDKKNSVPFMNVTDAYSEADISGDTFLKKDKRDIILDPQERIRRRLEEILGTKTSAAIPEDKKNQSDIVEKEKVNESLANEVPVFSTENSATADNTPEIIAQDSVDEVLSKEAKKPLSEFEKVELEHALEETLLHSLEKLPEIQTHSPKEQKTIQPVSEEGKSLEADIRSFRSFSDWLKFKSGTEFGKVEEVHSDADAGFTTIESLHQEKKSVTPPQISSQVSAPPLQEKHKPEPEMKAPDSETPSNQELIDRFIATEPKISPSRAEFYSPVNQAKKSVTEDENLVSETLAKIYADQGNLLKAHSAYQKLILIYPEKRAYFAALIKEIDERLNRPEKEDL